jgi:hypothetical protein
VQPSPLALAGGVASAYPVVQLATGLNVPDDLLYVPSDGSVLVGEHGDGHLDRIAAPGQVTRLPQVVPEAEGIAQLGDATFVADQYNARVVQLTATGVKTLIQLQPVASGENLDGISTDDSGTGLVVPDSPHGVVLFVDAAGHITSRVGGFSRPAGAWPEPGGYLIADENASAVFEIRGGRATRIAGGLPGVDDAVRTSDGHVLAILPAAGQLRDVSAGRNVATGLRNPQGLGFTGAENVLVTESDSGRVLMIVRTLAVEVPSGTVQLQPGQPVCVGVLRAPGFTADVKIHEVVGGVPLTDPGAGNSGEVLPAPCHAAVCTMTVSLSGGAGAEIAHLTYRD